MGIRNGFKLYIFGYGIILDMVWVRLLGRWLAPAWFRYCIAWLGLHGPDSDGFTGR